MTARRNVSKIEGMSSDKRSQRKSQRPPKNENILAVVHDSIKAGRFTFSSHVHDRMRERLVTQMDIKEVLLGGRREKSRDRFDETLNSWSYSFRGKLEDGRELRITVAQLPNGILIISAVDLKKR